MLTFLKMLPASQPTDLVQYAMESPGGGTKFFMKPVHVHIFLFKQGRGTAGSEKSQ